MGLLLGAAHGVLLARRFTNRSCHALSSRPKVRMPCPITTLHSDLATEHACNTVEPALAVVQGRARGEHARRLGALGRAGKVSVEGDLGPTRASVAVMHSYSGGRQMPGSMCAVRLRRALLAAAL